MRRVRASARARVARGGQRVAGAGCGWCSPRSGLHAKGLAYPPGGYLNLVHMQYPRYDPDHEAPAGRSPYAFAHQKLEVVLSGARDGSASL